MRADTNLSKFREKSSPVGEEIHNRHVADAVIEIARERTKILESMRAALLRGDDGEALERARELTGLPTKRA